MMARICERKRDRAVRRRPGFAPDDDTPIPYMARIREDYQAIGYTTA
jgi:hypothetical protein